MTRARHLLLPLTLTAGLAVAGASGLGSARAQVPPVDSTTTTSSTTTRPSTTTTSRPATTTTSGVPGPPTTPTTGPGPTTSTTSLDSGTTTTTSTTSAPPPAGAAPNDGDGGATATPGQAIPPEYLAFIASVRRSPANSTTRLLAAIAPLVELGMTQQEAVNATFGRFPVAGMASFTDDWWFPRYNVPFHLHQGTDIFAAMGTPVRSPADGTLKHSNGGLGGMADYVYTADGTYFYLAHLSAFVEGQGDGMPVKTGDVIGFVGNTGDAAGGAPHVHFEVHIVPARNPYLFPPAPAPTVAPTPSGRRRASTTTTTAPLRQPVIVGNLSDPVLYGRGVLPAFDPKPFLDTWIEEALAGIPRLVASLQRGRPQAVLATVATRRLADEGIFASPSGPSHDSLLWASSANPAGGALRMAEAAASAAADVADYPALARRQLADRRAALGHARRAEAVLAPLTPAPLRAMLALP